MFKNKKKELPVKPLHYDISLDVDTEKNGDINLNWNVHHDGDESEFSAEDFSISLMTVMIIKAKEHGMTQEETKTMLAQTVDMLYNGYKEVDDKEDK